MTFPTRTSSHRTSGLPGTQFNLFDWIGHCADHQEMPDSEQREFAREFSLLNDTYLGPGGLTVPWGALNRQSDVSQMEATIRLTAADALRGRSVLVDAGAETVSVPANTASVIHPRLNGNPQASWCDVGEECATLDVSLGGVTARPKRLSGMLTVAAGMRKHPEGERFLRAMLLNMVAEQIDKAAITGRGTEYEPTGVLKLDGVHTASLSSATVGSDAWIDYIEARRLIESAGGVVTAIMAAPNVHKHLSLAQRPSGDAVWENGRIDGAPAFSTPRVADSLMVVGDWSVFNLVVFGGLEVEIDYGHSSFRTGGYRIRATAFIDFIPTWPRAFAALTLAS